jgi:hypothetical protein
VVQGEGTFGAHRVSAPTMIRFGAMTQDELFVCADAAKAGVRIENPSASDPLVILKHFGPATRQRTVARAARAVRWTMARCLSLRPRPPQRDVAGPGRQGQSGRRAGDRSRHDARSDGEREVDGTRFDGVDLFLFDPHVSIDAATTICRRLRDKIAARGLVVGSLVAPVWPPTGGGAAMGSADERRTFLTQVRKACEIGRRLRELGIRRTA